MLHSFKIIFFLFCYQTLLSQALPNLLPLHPVLCSAHSWGWCLLFNAWCEGWEDISVILKGLNPFKVSILLT